MLNIDEFKSLPHDAVNEGVWMDINHPITGEKTDAKWLIASNESNQFKAAERALRLKTMKAARKKNVNADETEEDAVNLIAALVLDWKGMTDGKNAVLDFSKEAVVELFEMPLVGNDFLEQVSSFATDTQAFFKASRKPSAMPSSTK